MTEETINAAIWEKLEISNDFIFGKVMQDPELCRKLLQRILPDLTIDHVEYPEAQKIYQRGSAITRALSTCR